MSESAALAARVAVLVASDAQLMTVLKIARGLNLPDWAIGAGAVRNVVWDALSAKPTRTAPADIDVLYFDPLDTDLVREAAAEAALARQLDLVWQVRNQARMHLRNGDPPYRDTADALRFWLETPTCVAVRLEADDRLTVIAPHGLVDLFALALRPTPQGRIRLAAYRERLAAKDWIGQWPGLTIDSG
jgi:uncharacterized protein